MKADPFDALLEIENNCKKNALPLPSEKNLGETWTGIGFISGNLHLLVPLSEIREVLPYPSLTPIPSSASWFKGVANLRGHFLPITDLENFISNVPLQVSPSARVLVVEFDKSGLGFVVNKVIGLQHFREKNRLPLVSEENNPKFLPFLQGEFEEDHVKWKIISLKALSQTTEFYHVMKSVSGGT
jgi:twitching motility protein PilI